MEIDTYIPSAVLRPFIRAYRIVESRDGTINRVLPDTSPTLALRYKGQVSFIAGNREDSLPYSVVSGLRTSPRLFRYAPDTATIVVLFRETGARAFFKQPLHELFEESVSLHNFIGRQEAAILEEQLTEAGSNGQRIAIVERFLGALLYDSKPDKVIAAAVQKIHAANGIIKIKELADSLYISQDRFEKRFRQMAGTSPKQFSSIVRMKTIIRLRAQPQTFTRLAFEAGYFDQPHFNRDFKLFTGLPPKAFFKSAFYWWINDFLQGLSFHATELCTNRMKSNLVMQVDVCSVCCPDQACARPSQKTVNMNEFSFLVRVPVDYTSEQAKAVNPKWQALIGKWKNEETYVASFPFPGESYVVTGADGAFKKEAVICENLRVVSHIILRAPGIEKALEQAKGFPILKYGGTVEVREVQARVPAPVNQNHGNHRL